MINKSVVLKLTTEAIIKLANAAITAPMEAFVGISLVLVISPAAVNRRAIVATHSSSPGIPYETLRKSIANFEFAKTGIKIEGVI